MFGSADASLDKLLVRDIPSNVYYALQALATKHNRSLVAEAREAFQAWVAPEFVEPARNQRRQEVAKRLNTAFSATKSHISRYQELCLSEIALEIGMDRSEELEDWFLGVKEPSFSELASVATHLGVCTEYLQHGKGEMFWRHNIRLPRNPFDALPWINAWDHRVFEKKGSAPAQQAASKTQRLLLVRGPEPQGNLVMVKLDEKDRAQILTTPYNISEHVGSSGEADTAHFILLLELLSKSSTQKPQIASYRFNEAKFSSLLSGYVHPLSLAPSAPSVWWEDVWDITMVEKANHWPGWVSFCERMHKYIAIGAADLATKVRAQY